jgi:hypothetical protein
MDDIESSRLNGKQFFNAFLIKKIEKLLIFDVSIYGINILANTTFWGGVIICVYFLADWLEPMFERRIWMCPFFHIDLVYNVRNTNF